MTIVGKDEEGRPSETKNSQAGDPPSYADATSSSSASTPTPIRKSPCNYLYISEKNKSIRGTWVVDADLNIPVALRTTIPGETQPKNFVLDSHNGSVTADISLVGNETGKVLLETRSHNGSVKTTIIHCSAKKKFALKACSHNGSVTVYLPRDFNGPISFKNGWGSTSFSSAIEEGLTVFSRQGREGLAYLGDWASSGYAEVRVANEWSGDELILESKNGSIRVYYNDDEEATLTGGLSRWVSKLFGGGQGSSPQSLQTNPHIASSSSSYPAGAPASLISSPAPSSPEQYRASNELPKKS